VLSLLVVQVKSLAVTAAGIVRKKSTSNHPFFIRIIDVFIAIPSSADK
jgi:hypothetical protein